MASLAKQIARKCRAEHQFNAACLLLGDSSTALSGSIAKRKQHSVPMTLLLRKHAAYWLWLVGGFAGLLLEVKEFGNDSGVGLGLGIVFGAVLGWVLVPKSP